MRFFTEQMPFLSFNQQFQNNEGTIGDIIVRPGIVANATEVRLTDHIVITALDFMLSNCIEWRCMINFILGATGARLFNQYSEPAPSNCTCVAQYYVCEALHWTDEF